MSESDIASDMQSLLSVHSLHPEPSDMTKLIRRLRAMTLKLLPVEVDLELITAPTSSIIHPGVVRSYAQAGGDFANAVPYALLMARASFIRDAKRYPTDYDENLARATACEMLARRIVHQTPADMLQTIMSSRYQYTEPDGDKSAPTSALESAIDQGCLQFLSSTEAQHVVSSLWKGEWVQRNNDNDDIDYVEYDRKHDARASFGAKFATHFNPQRLGVPRYQNIFRQLTWVAFLGVYTAAVASPLNSVLDPAHNLDGWEVALYIMAASQMLEEVVKLWKNLRLSSVVLSSIDFWSINALITDGLLLAALALRFRGVYELDREGSSYYRLKSFQTLSCVAPLLWLKLITIFDGWKVVGTMQVVVFRMLRETLIFFLLLAIMALGFVQSMVALDAADTELSDPWGIINILLQALLGSPDFDSTAKNFSPPFGLVIYYAWSFLTIIILLNILIALFGTAYSDIAEDATSQYLCHFSYKAISMIRAPDSFVYPSPFNLIETLFVAPFEFVLSPRMYTKLNIYVMSVLFAFPLTVIALYESQVEHSRRFLEMFPEDNVEAEGDPAVEDPGTDNQEGNRISKVPFAELVSTFPDATLGDQATIVNEIKKLAARIESLQREVDDKKAGGSSGSEK